jgi:DNA invertase Pin-like site-specific DNA recombinase
MKTQVCTYARVSTDIQDFTRQQEDIKKYCKANGYTIVQEFAEKESGKIKERLELKRLMEYCKDNKDTLMYVIVSELSRIGRTGRVIETIEILNDLKIGFIALKENLKTLNEDRTINHTSTLMVSILSGINAFELETTKYRSKSGLLHSAQQGNWGGGKMMPYGYMREEKKLVINPVESEIIKEIFNMYISGKGCLAIATILNSRKVPTRTGVRWRDKVVYDIICNPLYCGKRIFRKDRKESKNKPARQGEAVILSAPAIISEETYNESTNKRVSNYSKLGINSKFEYLLNDRLIKCGCCGKSYYAHKRSNDNDNAYKCISIRYGNNCGNTSISIPKLEFAIKYIFLFEWVHLVKLEGDNSEELKNENQLYEQELKKIKVQLNRLIDLYTDNLITKQDFQAKQDELKTKERKIDDIRKGNIDRIRDLNKAKALIKKISHQNLADSYEVYKITKEMLHQVIKNIVITKDSRKLTSNPMDKTVKVDIISITGVIVTIYLSQRAKFFLWNGNEVEYFEMTGLIETTGGA